MNLPHSSPKVCSSRGDEALTNFSGFHPVNNAFDSAGSRRTIPPLPPGEGRPARRSFSGGGGEGEAAARFTINHRPPPSTPAAASPFYPLAFSLYPFGRSFGRPFRAAFSLVEILLVVTLLSLIMLALMAVFSSTQTAFRASITQSDVLQGGRAIMDMVSADFRQMAPSDSIYAPEMTIGTNFYNIPSETYLTAPVNFWLSTPATTLQQSLIGVSQGQSRTNQVQCFFILSCQNQIWKGVGYFVDTRSSTYIFPLYRYDSSWTTLSNRWGPTQIFSNFLANLSTPVLEANPNLHHLLDGVVNLNVRAYDPNGVMLTNGYAYNQPYLVRNATFNQVPPVSTFSGDVSMIMCSNTLPAAVEIQMGVLEDRSLAQAASFGLTYSGTQPYYYSNYLSQQAGKVHLFRQRVDIPNVDPTAYQ